ncbi:MAG TPA: hypothetical protein VFV67_00665 [Actinophytocola sp.]|uniref:hypothetical protein n=1 Tax=Actinophytocola sp. TaxID=1872138 RepID=UPI002DBDC6D2|nr:hypothetical protein [Actinophytocola sp.]HEU5469135.1 hypothetical protein [Actinophytocola sp.]
MTEYWEDEVDRAVRRLRADTPEMAEAAFAAGRARLAAGAPPDARRRVEPWLAVTAAVVVVATGAVLTVNATRNLSSTSSPQTTMVPPPRPSPTNSTYPPLPPVTDRPYHSLDWLAEGATDLPQAPGQYLYVLTHQWIQDRLGSRLEMFRELWIPRDRAGQWQQNHAADVSGPAIVPFPGANVRRADGGDFDWLLRDRSLKNLSEEELTELPRDPRALYQLLTTPGFDPGAAFELMLNWMNRLPPAEPRAAIILAMGYFPWLEVSTTTTRDGRPAVALAIEVDPGVIKSEILVDPDNGRIIGNRYRHLQEGDGSRAGQVRYEEAITYAVVDTIGQRPAR